MECGNRPLIEQIERDALDDSVGLARALRTCISLGGRSNSAELRDWARRELDGYQGPVGDIPDYRTIVAPLVIDGIAGNHLFKGQQISTWDLPEFARERISEELPLPAGVGELEELVRSARATGEPIRVGLPGGAELARVMTLEMKDQFRAVERVYWSVSPTAVVGVLDQIRTRLVSLVAEVQAVAADPEDPSPAALTNAVNVAVYGQARDINVTAAQASGAATATDSDTTPRPWWRRAKVVGTLVVGAATIAGTVIAWLQWK